MTKKLLYKTKLGKLYIILYKLNQLEFNSFKNMNSKNSATLAIPFISFHEN